MIRYGTTLTRTGTDLTAQILARLHIPCTYGQWHEYIFPYCPQPAGSLVVNLNHRLQHANTQSSCFRIVRNPGHGYTSYHTWFQNLLHTPEALSMDMGLDIGLNYSAGNMFGLGYIEEFYLQTALLHDALRPEAIFAFEGFKTSAEHVGALLQFLRVKASALEVEQVFTAQQEADRAAGLPRPLRPMSAALLRRMQLMRTACNLYLGYEFEYAPALHGTCSWPQPILADAARLYTERCITRAAAQIHHVDAALLRSILHTMYESLDELPLLELCLATELITSARHTDFVLSKFLPLVHNANPFIAARSALLLALHDKTHHPLFVRKLAEYEALFNLERCRPWWPIGGSCTSPADEYFMFMIEQQER